MPSDLKRKLAAIMFTDIAGYTALSSTDETTALKLLDKQEEILTPIIKEFNGTLHNRIGDGLLFTFPTVTDAVKCGIKIQKETKEVENLNLRIGIHEGEITLKDGDALGDDVNVASRIDPYAAEGGIVISGKVQQNISSLPEFKTKFISQPSLKGVKQDVKIFCIVSHGLPETDFTKVTAKLEKDVKKLGVNQKSMATIGILGVLIVGLIIWLSGNNKEAHSESEDIINIYFPTIVSNDFGSKKEQTSKILDLMETLLIYENMDFNKESLENTILTQINSNWIDSVYSEIIINLTSKFFQKHNLFSMDDIDHELAKQGMMVDFNQPSITQKAGGTLEALMSQFGSLINDDERTQAIKDFIKIGTHSVHFIYVYNLKPSIGKYDLFVIQEAMEANKVDMEDASRNSGGATINYAFSSSAEIVDDIVNGIDNDVHSILLSKFPSTVISQNGKEVLIKTHPLAKPKKYSTFSLDRQYDCTDSIKFYERRLRHLEEFISSCELGFSTGAKTRELELCETLLNNEAGFYMFSRDEYYDLLNKEHKYCFDADNFAVMLGVELIINEVYDSTAIGTLKGNDLWFKLEKGDRLIIE